MPWPTTHGRSRTPEWRTWKAMLQRCCNPKNPSYPNYGGRDIAVCEAWLGVEGFAHFFADVGPRPSARHSIERIENDGNYEPGNCRWATRREQSNNRRGVRWITVGGVTATLAEWARRAGLAPSSIARRLARGMCPALAVTAPAAPGGGGQQKGGPVGARNSNAKLTEAQARSVLARCRAGEQQFDVARALSVSPTTISRIVLGKSWSHLDERN